MVLAHVARPSTPLRATVVSTRAYGVLLWGGAAVVTIYSVQEHCIMADMFEITAI